MRVVACVGLVLLGVAGCQALGGKGPAKATPTSRPTAPAPRAEAPPPPTPPAPTPVGGVIAGQVVDSFNRYPRATIEIVTASDGDGAPVVRTVSTDERGYFTILNVKPGQSYQLIARTQDGPVVMGGTTWVQPPNARVVIRVSEDFTPPSPPVASAGATGPKPPVTIERPTPIAPPVTAEPAPRPPAEMGTPRAPEGASSPPPVAAPLDRIARDRGLPTPPAASIPNGPRVPPPPTIARPRVDGPEAAAPAPGAGTHPLAPLSVTPVPSCQLVGKQLINFALALPSPNGEYWEYRRDRRGKLVLLDFWGTWCPHCRVASREHLSKLHDLYGRRGLEIVGIAYERDRTFGEQVQRVLAAKKQDGIAYRMLMGYGDQCPVKKQFNVQAFPTLVLLDEDGTILRQYEGLDEARLIDLQNVIRQKLLPR